MYGDLDRYIILRGGGGVCFSDHFVLVAGDKPLHGVPDDDELSVVVPGQAELGPGLGVEPGAVGVGRSHGPD